MEIRGATSQKAAETAALDTRERKPAVGTGVDVLRERWLEELAAIALSDGDGDLRPAEVDDVTAVLGRETFAPPGPAEVEEVFRVLAGEHGVSLDDWEIDEQHLSDSGVPRARALPVTLLGSTFTRRDAMSAVARAFDVTPDEAEPIINSPL